MRTTITLDDDVIAKLKAEMQRRGVSFKEAVNDSIRMGLATRMKSTDDEPYVVDARPMGLRPGLSLDSISQLLEEVEGPFHR